MFSLLCLLAWGSWGRQMRDCNYFCLSDLFLYFLEWNTVWNFPLLRALGMLHHPPTLFRSTWPSLSTSCLTPSPLIPPSRRPLTSHLNLGQQPQAPEWLLYHNVGRHLDISDFWAGAGTPDSYILGSMLSLERVWPPYKEAPHAVIRESRGYSAGKLSL